MEETEIHVELISDNKNTQKQLQHNVTDYEIFHVLLREENLDNPQKDSLCANNLIN